MKFGILTFHRAHNYGALLQAIATREYLSREGHDAYFLDYSPDYICDAYSLFSFKKLLNAHGARKKCTILFKDLFFVFSRAIRIRNFNVFIDQYILPYSRTFESSEQYDVVLYGSDQIWRKEKSSGNIFNKVYLAQNKVLTKKSVAWAASVGVWDFSDSEIRAFKQLLLNFHKLSVREKGLQDELKNLGLSSCFVSDPTLLLSAEEWESLIPLKRLVKEPYVLYYRLQDSFDMGQVRAFAKKRNLKLVVITATASNRVKADYVFSNGGPDVFLSLFKYAEYTLTSSYHGLVFSLIFKKNFYASYSHNSGRAESLLTFLNLGNHMIEPNVVFRQIPVIDYTVVDRKIQELKSNSHKFIQEI